MAHLIEVQHPPDLRLLYAKALATSFAKGAVLPAETLVRTGVEVDRAHLAAYNRVCGFRLTDQLPLTYPHVLAFPLAVQLVARRSFPLPLPGVVHIRNTIRQHRAIGAHEPLTVRVHVEGLRPHPKGRQFDIVSVVQAGGEAVWEETSTTLHRGDTGGHRAEYAPSPEREALREVARWQVPKDIGRRYARVSGDINPIHLHPLAARLFGFSRAIAHGMWTKARALSALADRLPEGCSVEVAFRKPLLLPATVNFAVGETDDGWAFAVRSRGGAAHLHGLITHDVE